MIKLKNLLKENIIDKTGNISHSLTTAVNDIDSTIETLVDQITKFDSIKHKNEDIKDSLNLLNLFVIEWEDWKVRNRNSK